MLLISLSPPHFHLSTDSICREEAGHQSSRSDPLCDGQQCACTSPLLCEEECRIFSSPPTCEWAPSALGEETSLRVQKPIPASFLGLKKCNPTFFSAAKRIPTVSHRSWKTFCDAWLSFYSCTPGGFNITFQIFRVPVGVREVKDCERPGQHISL